MIDETKTYVLGQRDTTGYLFGLSMVQVMVAGAGMGFMVLFRMGGMGFVPTLIPAAIGLGVAKARWRNRFAYEWLPVVLRWVARRKSRLWWTETPWDGEAGDRPAVLTGVVVTEEQFRSRADVAVVWDRTKAEATVLLEASGVDFAIQIASEQAQLLADFGKVISAFATEDSAIARVGWSELAARQSLDEHMGFVREQTSGSADPARRADYLEMVRSVGSDTTKHRLLLSITVSSDAVSRASSGLVSKRRSGKSVDDRCVEALETAATQLTRGLASSGVAVHGLLSRSELAEAMQTAIDPSRELGLLPAAGRLRHRLGSDVRMGPQETDEEFRYFATDGTVHRTYRIAGFPRTAQRADWMVNLLSRPEAARTVTTMFEPVPPRKSQQRIARQLAKLDAGETLKLERGRRISRAEDKAREDVLDLEADLVEGFGVVGYYSLVTISARSVEALAVAAEEFEATAGTAGLMLAPCDGEQASGWALTLPLGIGASKSRMAI